MKRKTRVAILTSGGDCQGLNAAIRGVGKALTQYVENIEIFGMYDGYRGLAESDYRFMEAKDFPASLALEARCWERPGKNISPARPFWMRRATI